MAAEKQKEDNMKSIFLKSYFGIIFFTFLSAFGQPLNKEINDSIISIEVKRTGDTSIFYLSSKENITLSDECGEWKIEVDTSLFKFRNTGSEYPGYIGCYERELPLNSTFYNFRPISLRKYCETFYYPFKVEPYNADTIKFINYENNDTVLITSKREFLEYERNFPKFQYFYSYGSGVDDVKVVRFPNGTHLINVTFKMDCQFGKTIPGSDVECEPDYSKIWWKGKISQRFKLIKTNNSYEITKY
jgi:hypothetical protein